MAPRKTTRTRGRSGGESPDAGASASPDAGTEAVPAGDRGGADVVETGAGGSAPGAAIPERVGSVAVEVDRPAILEEAAAIAASSGDAPAAPAELEQPAAAPDVAALADGAAPAVRMLVAQCCSAFAPGWRIEREESDGIADAAALVMAHWMPAGAIDPKYLAIVTLATAIYGVAAKRRRDDGTWAPLRAPRAPASSATATDPPPAPAGGSPLRLV